MKQTPRTLYRQAGFTLIELMAVVLIIGLLIGVVGPNVWQMIGKGNRTAAESQMTNFKTAISAYRMTAMALPESLDNLVQEDEFGNTYLDSKSLPLDPWQHEYYYEPYGDGVNYRIVCFGSDGIEGGEGEAADIVFDTME